MSVEIVRFFAGENRLFRCVTGTIWDIEEASGKTGIGALYLRLASHQYFAKDVMTIVRLALVEGGMDPVEAERLVQERAAMGLLKMQELALDILMAIMEGIEEDDTPAEGDPERPYDVGAILHSFVQAGIAPESVRSMSYADFVGIMRATGRKDVDAPSEEDFEAMVKDYERRHGK
ncbi:MAG: gene transfer agent family protein [Rhodobacteraceae bacterium]|nr:gene transfer agent family protein [Paracoccaceae bacterium]